ncbi:MAG: circadian clock KaiB family protein [Blastocatellia bacterium]
MKHTPRHNPGSAPAAEPDLLADFEKALAAASEQKFVFRLFVTGAAPRSQQALRNIKRICEEHLAGRYELEVIDVYQQPHRAVEDQIFAAPTLIRQHPPPYLRLVGTLARTSDVLFRLGLGS